MNHMQNPTWKKVFDLDGASRGLNLLPLLVISSESGYQLSPQNEFPDKLFVGFSEKFTVSFLILCWFSFLQRERELNDVVILKARYHMLVAFGFSSFKYQYFVIIDSYNEGPLNMEVSLVLDLSISGGSLRALGGSIDLYEYQWNLVERSILQIFNFHARRDLL